MESTQIKERRGSDAVFLELMAVTGNALLKLLDVPPDEAKRYIFRSVVLKDKRLEPDVEGFPIMEGDDGRVFLEFQGYKDQFIRHRLLAKIFQGCAVEKYTGRVFGAIIYTDNKYRKAALSVDVFSQTKSCRFAGCIREITLTDFTETQLYKIDPKLVVLAPFTLSGTMKKTDLFAKSKQWKNQVKQIFSEYEQQNALNIIGLLVLDRFRKLTYQEVIAMLGFDLRDTLAGQQMWELARKEGHQEGCQIGRHEGRHEGRQEGRQEGAIEEAYELVLEVLSEKFGIVPSDIIDKIKAITHRETFKILMKQIMRCDDLDQFKAILATVKD